MNTTSPSLNTEPAGRRTIAFLGTLVFVIVSIGLSRSTMTPAPATPTGDRDKPSTPTTGAVAAAEAFLRSLDVKQREKAEFEFGSEKKANWSNLPVTIVPRNGIRLGDLTTAQHALAMAAVAAVLSKDGYQKIVNIMDGDQQLAVTQGRGGRGGAAMFGSDQYYLAIFGKPSATQPWMVQFGGHHLGLNVTVIGSNFVLTPTHTGAQPAVFRRDGRDIRPLGLEIDAGTNLINALDEKQRSQAVIADRPQSELLLGPGRDARKPPDPQGIKGSALTDVQQTLLLDLIAVWVKIADGDAVAARMAEIKDKIGETYFAWKGPTTKGRAAYFRIQGPTIVIEYAPQGGTDHIHTVVRNPKEDYGAGVSKK
jgi:hypothetical protein